MPDDDPHGKFRDLCMLYGDFNRAVFLEEVLHFVAGFGATAAELSAIRTAVQKRAKRFAKRAQKGRPRASDSDAWIQKAMTGAFRKRVLGWSWSHVTESLGMKPTKPNVRTVQRREAQFAEFVANAIPSEWWDTVIVRERYEKKLREGGLVGFSLPRRLPAGLRRKSLAPRGRDTRKLVPAFCSLL